MPDIVTMQWIWLGAIVLFGVIEASTAELVSIWFVAGALGAFAVSFVTDSLWVQVAAFLVLSIAALLVLRPIVKKKIQPKVVPTNADRLIGASALVTAGAEPGELARVAADGQNWAALCDEPLQPRDKVHILAIEGVKLIVKKL